MNEKDMALEIRQKFIEMENEIQSLRSVLQKSWTSNTHFETFVQKGIEQLQTRQKKEEAAQDAETRLQSARDDAALLPALHAEILRKMKVE